MQVFFRGLLPMVVGLALSAHAVSSNVCAVQNTYTRSADAGRADKAKTQVMLVRGRAVFSQRGFWVLTEPGCAGIPLAEVLENMKPKVPFQLVKDEKYRELQNLRDRSRHDIVVVEVEGRLDPIKKKARDLEEGGSGAIHISAYKYMLALRQVRVVQLQ